MTMETWFSDSMRLVYLVALCVLLASVEAVWPLVSFPRERREHYKPNLALTGLLVLSNLVLAALPTAASVWATSHAVGMCGTLTLDNWTMLLIGVAGLDFSAYWAHRTLHHVQLGWHFHAVHHSEPYVDVTTSLRQHPVETAWRTGFTAAGVVIFGVPLWCLAIYFAMSAMNALLEHSNVAWPSRLDGWLRIVVVTPNMHKVHHSRLKAETNTNYSNILSVWDRLFGTYRRATRQQAPSYGLDGFDRPELQSTRGLLIGPFVRAIARRH